MIFLIFLSRLKRGEHERESHAASDGRYLLHSRRSRFLRVPEPLPVHLKRHLLPVVDIVGLGAQGGSQIERRGQVAVVVGMHQFRPARAAGISIRLGLRDAPAGHPPALGQVLAFRPKEVRDTRENESMLCMGLVRPREGTRKVKTFGESGVGMSWHATDCINQTNQLAAFFGLVFRSPADLAR